MTGSEYKVRLWSCDKAAPTVYIHSVAGDGHNVMAACERIGCPDFNLVSICDFDYDGCMTPWKAPGVRKGQGEFAGNGTEHLRRLVNEIMPEIESRLSAPSLYNAIAGYSLAGLFALWSTWNTECFSRVACGSASFWYPSFVEYAEGHEMMRIPDYAYFSLGDNESNTRHPVMNQVGSCTEKVLQLMSRLDIPHDFEVNHGNHFSDPDGRLAKAIRSLLLADSDNL